LSWYDGFAQFTPHAPSAYIELADPGPGEEIAAIYHVGNAPALTGRELHIQHVADATPSQISILCPLYEPLQYPLLFPHGTLGWGKRSMPAWLQIEYYKLQLLCESRFTIMTCLSCEYICDMYSCVEDERLQFIKSAKQNEALQFATTEDADDNEVDFTLPANFTGSTKYYADRTADSLAFSCQLGKPDLMITATTNPSWPELQQALQGRSATECPHITVRVFKVLLLCASKLSSFTLEHFVGSPLPVAAGNQACIPASVSRVCHRVSKKRFTACAHCPQSMLSFPPSFLLSAASINIYMFSAEC
jgi:Helitron helicase-like domain at N-terminus